MGVSRWRWSVAEGQVDLLAVETVGGALGDGLPGELLAGEGDQRLAAALAAEVVQDEDGVWLELHGEDGGWGRGGNDSSPSLSLFFKVGPELQQRAGQQERRFGRPVRPVLRFHAIKELNWAAACSGSWAAAVFSNLWSQGTGFVFPHRRNKKILRHTGQL